MSWPIPVLRFAYEGRDSHCGNRSGLTVHGLGCHRHRWGEARLCGLRLGLIGAASTLGLFVAIGVAGMLAAQRAPDRFGMLLAVGITTWVVVQALLNLGAVMALLPVTGVTLPFLSLGGSSVVVTLAAMGVLMNVARQGR